MPKPSPTLPELLSSLLFLTGLATPSSAAESNGYHWKQDVPFHPDNATEYQKERLHLDLYYPAEAEGFSTVVWFHGGGLRSGEKSIPKPLRDQGVAVVAANYRLFPQARCPEYIEDAAAAVAWVFDNIHAYGGDRERIFVSGHSAGGYLTSMVGMAPSYLAEHDIDADQIAALIPFSGHTITHFTVREERGISGNQPIIDEFAPLFHVRDDAAPLVLITGDRDLEMLGRYEENAYFWRMMKEVGREDTELFELEGFNHGEMATPAFGILLKIMRTIPAR